MNSAKKIRSSVIAAVLLTAILIQCAPALNIAGLSLHADSGEPVYAENKLPQLLPFPDVTETDWFYADVTKLYSSGIINGYPDGSFYPEREITNAEFIKILICTDSGPEPYFSGTALFPGSWASKYITSAYERGIITAADLAAGFEPDQPITRSSMTKMMILALGIEPARIDDPFTDISDIYASTAYNEYLLRGYLNADGSRVYNGSGNASRSEAAAIAVRVIEYRADSYSYKRDAILSNASENPLNTEFELLDLFCILNREFMDSFTFRTSIPWNEWKQYYLHSNIINLQYFYSSSIVCQDFHNTKYTITLEYDTDTEQLRKYHTDAEEKAGSIVASIITDEMNGFDKLKAIHDYIILNCEYDYANYLAGTISKESLLAYGVLCGRSAVCQGYSAAFNMLCEEAGIRSIAVGGYAPNSADSHSWNMVLIDGQIYYVDVTHDDPIPDRKGKISYRYYCLTESEMTSLGYVWDKNHSNLKYFY